MRDDWDQKSEAQLKGEAETFTAFLILPVFWKIRKKIQKKQRSEENGQYLIFQNCRESNPNVLIWILLSPNFQQLLYQKLTEPASLFTFPKETASKNSRLRRKLAGWMVQSKRLFERCSSLAVSYFSSDAMLVYFFVVFIFRLVALYKSEKLSVVGYYFTFIPSASRTRWNFVVRSLTKVAQINSN